MSNPAFVNCTRFLNGHGPRRAAVALEEAIAELRPDEACDVYGGGPLIESFEAEIAELLGKEGAVFMPSGTMAQQIALRIYCDRNGSKNIAMHRTSHLEVHEQGAYEKLHGLSARLLADETRLFNIGDLQELQLPLAALLWELPQREIGGQLPEWEELVRETQWARENDVASHLDGARLWEAAPHYGRELAEISGLFDSVYVPFYKGLGGIAGAVLAGGAEFIAEAKVWQRRHGGNLISLYPYVLSARAGLKKHRDSFAKFRTRAQSLAIQLDAIEGISVVPKCPPTNMMHLHIAADAEALGRANAEIALRDKVQLFSRARPLEKGGSLVELSLGLACEQISDDDAKSLFHDLLGLARSSKTGM